MRVWNNNNKMGTTNNNNHESSTRVVSEEIFKQVYDSPSSLTGKQKCVTSDRDLRIIEQLLGMEPNTIGVPLWVSGITKKNYPKCNREMNCLDIVASGLSSSWKGEMIAKVILGKIKYVNVEAPRAIADLVCYQCKTPINNIRSFKCHNWAYAHSEMLSVLEHMKATSST